MNRNDITGDARSDIIVTSPWGLGVLSLQGGGIVEKTMPIDQSNVAIFNPTTGKADRVGVKAVDGKNVRVFKSNGEEIKVA